MTDDTMLNDGTAGTRTVQQGIDVPGKDFLFGESVDADKTELASRSLIPELSRSTRLRPAGAFVIAALILVLNGSVLAQIQTQAQTRQQLLQDLDSGQLRDAVLIGQQ